MAESHDGKEWNKCVEVGDAWIEARGSLPVLACVWYAQSLMVTGRVDEAVRWAETAVRNMPKDEEVALCAARSTYAQCLSSLGRFSHARKVLKEMVEKPIDHPETLEKQGHILLTISDKWTQGWAQHEARLREREMPDGFVQWDGKSKGVVGILHEQGIGDAVLFARWFPFIEKVSGNKPVWFGPEDVLARWMDGIGVTVGDRSEGNHTKVDYAIWSMSLPHYAECSRPWKVPTPIAPEVLVGRRRFRSQNKKVRVGVCWKGSAGGWHNHERSFKFDEFAEVFQPLDGVEFVNLTHDEDVPETAPFGKAHFTDIHQTGEEMTSLDLVISVDTSVVHIAGSLGIPTIVVAPTKPDWRYSWPRLGTSPFYPSVSVVRRKHSLDLTCLSMARRLLEKYASKVNAINERAA